MTTDRITGVFSSREDAERAEAALREAGIPAERMTASISQTDDGIAAEYPGQSYENQPGQSADEVKSGWYATPIRAGECALHVDVGGDTTDRKQLQELLLANGARQVQAHTGGIPG